MELSAFNFFSEGEQAGAGRESVRESVGVAMEVELIYVGLVMWLLVKVFER